MASLINITSIPLALYIHIPWCVKKCPYCDFNSHTLPTVPETNTTKLNTEKLDTKDAIDYFEEYVDALIKDIDAQLPLVQNREISSIFIGGGTPSLLPIQQYHRLFAHLKNILPLAKDIEVTMEANPGTLEHAPFEEYLEVGINRLSIGVQSFADDKLKALGRIHNANQAVLATQAAIKAGFKRINIDLMHGLPDQSVTEALHDIQMAHRAGATHISWYQLTIEPNTVFYRDTPVLPDDDNLADIEEQGSALLTKLGYRNYEVSAWVSSSDVPCRHNINYWQFGDYLAIGAGAHGKITINNSTFKNNSLKNGISSDAILNKGNLNNRKCNKSTLYTGIANNDRQRDEWLPDIYRYSKSRLPKDYVSYKGYPKMIGFKPIAMDELSSEFMLNVLRITEGVPLEMYSARTGQSISEILPTITQLQAQDLLVNREDWIQPTNLGRRYLNQVLQAFL